MDLLALKKTAFRNQKNSKPKKNHRRRNMYLNRTNNEKKTRIKKNKFTAKKSEVPILGFKEASVSSPYRKNCFWLCKTKDLGNKLAFEKHTNWCILFTLIHPNWNIRNGNFTASERRESPQKSTHRLFEKV